MEHRKKRKKKTCWEKYYFLTYAFKGNRNSYLDAQCFFVFFAVFQVLAACFYPALLEDDSLPLDVKERADDLLRQCDGGSVGKLLSLPSRYMAYLAVFIHLKG